MLWFFNYKGQSFPDHSERTTPQVLGLYFTFEVLDIWKIASLNIVIVLTCVFHTFVINNIFEPEYLLKARIPHFKSGLT